MSIDWEARNMLDATDMKDTVTKVYI